MNIHQPRDGRCPLLTARRPDRPRTEYGLERNDLSSKVDALLARGEVIESVQRFDERTFEDGNGTRRAYGGSLVGHAERVAHRRPDVSCSRSSWTLSTHHVRPTVIYAAVPGGGGGFGGGKDGN